MRNNTEDLKEFRERWQRIADFEASQLHKLSVKDKFYQLSSLMGMGLALRLNFNRENIDTLKVRSRWRLLKKGRR